jgi:hypothetical protein
MRAAGSIRVTGAAQAATLKSAKMAMTTRIFVYLKWMYRLGESGRLLVKELGRIDKCCKLMADVLRAHYFLSSKSAYTSEVTSGAAQLYLAAETILTCRRDGVVMLVIRAAANDSFPNPETGYLQMAIITYT